MRMTASDLVESDVVESDLVESALGVGESVLTEAGVQAVSSISVQAAAVRQRNVGMPGSCQSVLAPGAQSPESNAIGRVFGPLMPVIAFHAEGPSRRIAGIRRAIVVNASVS